MKALLTAEINELKAARRNGNVPKDLVDRIRQAVEQAEAAAEAKAENPEQTVQRLWGEVKRLNEEIKLDLEELHKRGLVDDEEYEKLKKEHARLDQLDPSDPKRMEGEKAYNSRVDALATKAGEKAEDIGDHDGKKVADDVKKKTEQQADNIDQIEKQVERQHQLHKSVGRRGQDDKAITSIPRLHNVTLASGDATNHALPKPPQNSTEVGLI